MENGAEPIAVGTEGINGLTISNAIHLSAWTDSWVELGSLDEDLYYNILSDKIKNSTFKKNNSKGNIHRRGVINMKLAAQLYTIRDFTKTPEDIRKSLKKISEIGYDYVQVSAFGPIEPELLKEYADESGVKICATHTPTDRILNDTEKVIEEHKLWGCDYVGWGYVPPENVANAEKFIEELLPAARKNRRRRS